MPEKKSQPKAKKTVLTLDDVAVWEIATADVRKLKALEASKPPVIAEKPQRQKLPEVYSGTISLETLKPQIAGTPDTRKKSSRQLDGSLQRRFEQGEMAFEGKIDLHGLTAESAHQRFTSFIRQKKKQGARCLLVITGKGAGGDGVLRKSLPHWCETPDLQPLILQIRQAQPRHGGAGATYILLRRNK